MTNRDDAQADYAFGLMLLKCLGKSLLKYFAAFRFFVQCDNHDIFPRTAFIVLMDAC